MMPQKIRVLREPVLRDKGYLIYNIKHIIHKTRGDYTIQIKAFKDNVETAYPSESQPWTHVAPPRKTHSIYDLDDAMVDSAGISSKFGL